MSSSDNKSTKKSFFNKFLDFIEVGGNKLPHPVTLFFLFALTIIIISGIADYFGLSVTYTGLNRSKNVIEEMTVKTRSLMNGEGLRYIFDTMVSNFTGFAPLGTVLVAMVGVGVAEGTGLMSAALRKMVLATPKKAITAMVVFAGIMSNIASDAGYVVLTPLGAVIFLSFGRHPLAGLAAAFAGVSGGFSANLLIGTIDPLLAGISTEAAKMINPDYLVTATSNWYFMVVSTFLITLLGTFVTEKIIEPRLGKYTGEFQGDMQELTDAEKKGLRYAGISLVIFLAFMLWFTLPENALLKVNGSLLKWTANGLVPAIMLFFLIPGIFYGIGAGTIKNDKDVAKLMGKSLGTMGGYLALAFAAAQFIAYFTFTNLGTVLAVKGAAGLQAIGFTGFPLIIAFILVTAFINLFMGSASAKWAIMAPIFVPMLMRVGYSPEFTQIAYRIGDSTTNIISPLMSYFAVTVAFAQKYEKDTGLGTLISLMVPYSLIFLIGWTLLLAVWFVLGLPLGPDAFMIV
jgi:aminobenzoyl-glutamate transport protein